MIERERRCAKPNRRPASGSSRLRKPGFGGQASGARPRVPGHRHRSRSRDASGTPAAPSSCPRRTRRRQRAGPTTASRTDANEPDRRQRAGPPRCHRPPGAASGARRPSRRTFPAGRGSGPRRRGATPEHSTAAARSPAPSCRVFGFVPRPPGPARRRSSSVADRGTHRSRLRHEIGPRIGPPLPPGASRAPGPERAAAARGFSRNRARFRARRFTIRGANGTSRRDFAPAGPITAEQRRISAAGARSRSAAPCRRRGSAAAHSTAPPRNRPR